MPHQARLGAHWFCRVFYFLIQSALSQSLHKHVGCCVAALPQCPVNDFFSCICRSYIRYAACDFVYGIVGVKVKRDFFLAHKPGFGMKNILAGAIIALGLSGHALAADIDARTYTKAPAIAAGISDWSGFYIGANGGYGWGEARHQNLTSGGGYFSDFTGGAFPNTQRIRPDGAVYGGQFGYNWQSAGWVFGLEGQFDGANLTRTDDSIYFPGITALRSKVDSFGTVTGRIGYALGEVLPYVKGGYAAARFNTTDFDTTNPTTLSHSDWRSGYALGAGIEWKFFPRWSVAVEYDYMDFGHATFAGSYTNFIDDRRPTVTSTYRDNLNLSTVTVRLNYQFGSQVGAR